MSKVEQPVGDWVESLSDDALLNLDNQLCFRLYAASRAITARYRPLLDALGLTYPQYLVLLAMWQWDSEGQLSGKTLKQLTARLRLDSGTMTPLFRRMEAAGWVEKRVDPDDRRVMRIALTAKGRALKQQAAAVPKSLLCEQGEALSPAEFEALAGLLDQMLGKLAE